MARRVRDGRRIDRWSWTSEEGVSYPVDVYLVTTNDLHSGNPRSTFRAISDELNIDEEDSDLDALRKRVRNKDIPSANLVWTDHLLVSFNGIGEDDFTSSDEEADDNSTLYSVSVGLSVHEVALSGDARDPDSQKHRELNWGKPRIHDGWPVVEEDAEGGDAAALVSDTPENRAALRAIVEGFEKLSERLVELMAPERIEATLAAATGARLLGSGEAPKAPRIRSRTRKR